jgi:hypothetical protein
LLKVTLNTITLTLSIIDLCLPNSIFVQSMCHSSLYI